MPSARGASVPRDVLAELDRLLTDLAAPACRRQQSVHDLDTAPNIQVQ
jgi:hypothetical protein